MATTRKHGRAGRKMASRRASARPSSSKSDMDEAREESDVSGEILGAGQGGPSRAQDLGGGPSRHSDEGTQSEQARHNEGLSGSEGLGSDDRVIDSSFSLSGRKYHPGKKHVTDVDTGQSGSKDESESDVDIGPDSRGDRYGQEHGRGMAPGAGA